MAEIYGFAIQVEGNAVKSITAIDQALNNLEKNATKTDSVFGGLFKFEMLKQGLSLLKQGFSEVYNFGKQMEQTMLSFEVMTGSKEKASALQKELKALADISPMADSAIYGSGKQLLNYGIEADKVGGYLSMLGDISAGDADKFQRLAYVFGQVSAQTKLQGGDLRQMIDAGFNPLNEMVKTTGKSYEQLKDDMGKGKISFDMVVNAMKTVTSEGGRFNNMMERQAQTVGGMESTLEGTLQSGMFGLFQRMSPVLKDILGASTEVAQSFADWITPKQSEILSGQRGEMMAMFEVLKNGNLPLDNRRDLINKLNTEYKDYLPNLITEKTSVSELSALQNVANQALLQKIKVTAQEEILQKYFKESAQAQKDLIEMQIQQERYKAGERNFAPVVYTAQGYIDRIKKLQAESTEADKNLNAFLSRMPELGVNANDIKTKGMSEAQQQAMSQLKSKMPASFVNSNINKMDTDAFIQSADSTAKMAAGGGLGQAKVINMNFNEPLMQINAGTLDSDDLQADAEKIIEQLTVELHQMAYETGTV
jgi:tape measure domain-containing protein